MWCGLSHGSAKAASRSARFGVWSTKRARNSLTSINPAVQPPTVTDRQVNSLSGRVLYAACLRCLQIVLLHIWMKAHIATCAKVQAWLGKKISSRKPFHSFEELSAIKDISPLTKKRVRTDFTGCSCKDKKDGSSNKSKGTSVASGQQQAVVSPTASCLITAVGRAGPSLWDLQGAAALQSQEACCPRHWWPRQQDWCEHAGWAQQDQLWLPALVCSDLQQPAWPDAALHAPWQNNNGQIFEI